MEAKIIMSSERLNDKETTPNTVSRRDFLKQVSAAAGALAASGVIPVLARPAEQDAILIRSVIINQQRIPAWESILPTFYEQFPNVNVELIAIPGDDWTNFLQKTAVMIASGQQVDNVELANEGFQLFTNSGIIVQLDDLVQNDPDIADFFQDVAPEMIESHMLDGHLYNLAFLWAAAGINYNKRLFDQADLEYPTNDWTLDDFTAAARAIGGLGDDVFGYAWPNRQWGGFVVWSYANDATLLEPEHTSGGDWLWDTFYPDMSPEERALRGGGWKWVRATANDPRNVEALQMLMDLAAEGNTSYMVNPAGLNDLIAAFTTDKLGMMVSHRAWIARFLGAGMTPDDFDVVYHPMWATQRPQFGASGLAVLTLSQHQEEAFAFLKHMTSRETQATFITGGVHTASRRSVTNDPAQNEGVAPSNWQAYYGMLDNLEAMLVPAPQNNQGFTDAMTRWISLAMSGELSAQEALDGFNTDLEAALAAV
jgi:multiple sugar transport system substrate-binding protein